MTEHRHSGPKRTLQIMVIGLVIIAVCLTLIYGYWRVRPLQRMRAMRAIDSIAYGIQYGHIGSPEPTGAVAQEVPILLYHGILNTPQDDGFSITQKAFNDHMVALKEAGYTTITTDQYLDFISGASSLPEKSIMITFDDGRKDSYYRADSILEALDFKAVMYIASGYSIVDGSQYYLDKKELLQMDKTGRWDIEAHADYLGTNKIVVDAKGTTENFLGDLEWNTADKRKETPDEYRSRVGKELATAKQRLTDLLGPGSISTLAFPFGDYGQHSDNTALTPILLEEARRHYQQVYVQFRKGEPYSSNYHNDNSFLSRRIEVSPRLSGAELVANLALSTAKPATFQARLDASDGWKNEWGVMSFSNDGLTFTTEPNATGVAMYLDGTKLLKKYRVTARFDIPDPLTNIELGALYGGKNDYVGCVFYDNRILVEHITGGTREPLTQIKQPPGYRTGSTFGIIVDGNNRIVCQLNGQNVLVGNKDISMLAGGPAVFARNLSVGKASAKLTAFRLEQ